MGKTYIHSLKKGSYFSVVQSVFGHTQTCYYLKTGILSGIDLVTTVERVFSHEDSAHEHWADFSEFTGFVAKILTGN